MKRFTKSLLLAAGVIALSGAAMAADIVRPPPVVARPIVVAPKVYDWAGHYIGIQGGWDNNRATTSAGGGATSDIDGTLFGVFAGWNFAHPGPLVWGIDGSINWDNASGAVSPFPSYHGEVDWKAFLRARAGIALDRVLFYGTVGATWANLKLVGPGCPGGGTCNDPSASGWTAGLGVDWAVTDRHFIRLDWAHSDYGTFNYTNPVPFSASMTSDTFTIGLAMKF